MIVNADGVIIFNKVFFINLFFTNLLNSFNPDKDTVLSIE